MTSPSDDRSAEFKTLRTIMRHREMVALRLHHIAKELERRAALHDQSKLGDEEFEGYVEMTRQGGIKGNPKAAAAVQHHYGWNPHHPEHHPAWTCSTRHDGMGFLDIIEMVVDWHVACHTYGDGDWEKSMAMMADRYRRRQSDEHPHVLSEDQWWLVEQVAAWLEKLDEPVAAWMEELE